MPIFDSLSAATVALADSAAIDVSDGVAAPAIGRSMLGWKLAVSRSTDPTRIDAPRWDRLLTSRVATPDRRLSDAAPAGRVKGDPSALTSSATSAGIGRSVLATSRSSNRISTPLSGIGRFPRSGSSMASPSCS